MAAKSLAKRISAALRALDAADGAMSRARGRQAAPRSGGGAGGRPGRGGPQGRRATWVEIGACYGLTKQGAQQRFRAARAKTKPAAAASGSGKAETDSVTPSRVSARTAGPLPLHGAPAPRSGTAERELRDTRTVGHWTGVLRRLVPRADDAICERMRTQLPGRRCHTVVDSPCGPLTLVATDGCLSGLHMERQRHRPAQEAFGEPDPEPFTEVAHQLDEYFAGHRTSFELELTMHGTDFQRKVWAALREIPYGRTVSYGQLADRLGQPTASRAVGLANGKNPIGIIVPCHRVVGADGSLTGYGGGLERKQFLLDFEREAAGQLSLFM